MNTNYFFKDKPLFGLDIGTSNIKVMQLESHQGSQKVIGYGVGGYDGKAIKDNVIQDFESMAASINKLFENNIIGKINTSRVALCIPSAKTYTRTMLLPAIKSRDIPEAVALEAEQYIPVPLNDLYLDHTIIRRTKENVEILAIAAPKKIVDSYMELTKLLGLETVAIDTSITAAARLFELQDIYQDIPSILIDFGSMSADITAHDETVIVTGTIPCGGDIFTDLIAKELKVSHDEAYVIKTKYGLNKSKKQDQIVKALKPSMDQLVKEIKRMLRYHDERSESNKKKIGQIVTMGGGANMPGLNDYLTSLVRMPVRMYDPWSKLRLGKLQPPGQVEKSIYITVAGLSLISSKELFHD
jgi:type IV pilus assembly protein PilM